MGKYNNMFTVILQSARGISRLLRQLPHFQDPMLPCSEPAGDFKSVELHQACFSSLPVSPPAPSPRLPTTFWVRALQFIFMRSPGLGQNCSLQSVGVEIVVYCLENNRQRSTAEKLSWSSSCAKGMWCFYCFLK